jgi:urea transport system permease protein
MNYRPIVILLIFGIIVPALNTAGMISDTTVNLWGRYFCFAIAALGVDLIWGYTGILSLCQAFFFCLGGYAIGMHMLLKTGERSVYGSNLPDFMVWNQVESLPLFWEPFHTFPLAFILALLVPGLIAMIFGYLAFRSRLKGVYFAIISQALALAMWLIFLRNETMLGGTNGLTDFKTLLGFELSDPASKRGLYIAAFFTLFGTYYLCRAIVQSKLGRLLIAIRDGEHRLRFIGYNVASYKVFIFVVASMLAALGGILYVPQTGIITPGRMNVQASIAMVIWAAVGGRGTLIGPIIGAILVNLLYSFLTGMFPGTWLYFLGFLFVGVVLFFPDGIIGLRHKVSKNALPQFLRSRMSPTPAPSENQD